MDQWNRIEDPKMNPCIYTQLIYNKEERIYNRERTVFNNCVGKTGEPHAKKMKLDHYLTPYAKINSKWIKDFNLKPKIVKLLEENLAVSSLTSHWAIFLWL